MRNIEELRTTDNRSVFNRAYKKYLESSKAEIYCSYCKYHRGENRKRKHYGGFEDDKKGLTYPNWKLVSKNRKQWIDKPLRKTVENTRWNNLNYITFKWK